MTDIYQIKENDTIEKLALKFNTSKDELLRVRLAKPGEFTERAFLRSQFVTSKLKIPHHSAET